VPEDADTPRFRTTIGSVYYVPEKSAIVWKIKQFGGGKEFLMRAELGLPSVKGSKTPSKYLSDEQLIWTNERDQLN
jgi:AP-1 complex subunit mu